MVARVVFFFSSRRRHTRFDCDWSSDVCSSDLNAYQKVGMFGMPALNSAINAGNNGNQGPQVRGFGFLHDGSVDTLFRFHNATVFNGGFDPHGGDTTRRPGGQVLLAVDTNPAPLLR